MMASRESNEGTGTSGVVDEFRHWQSVRQGLLQALDMITDDQLDFVPGEGLWSLGTVARHIANTEEGWFRYVTTRELDEWPPLVDEDTPTVGSVKQLLTNVHERTEAYLDTRDMWDLDAAFRAPSGDEMTLRWVIWHVLEHEIHHRGEIYLMLGLMGMEAPDL